MANQTFDFVVFGATSFVGQIICQHLLELKTDQPFSWAMAARSQSKLDELKQSLGTAANDIPVILADASDADALTQMCTQSKVVMSTVGPYALYGEPLIKACAESGTHYCDLAGEVQWIKRMQDKYAAAAEQSGARLVFCCGFDSVPSDLGVQFVQQLTAEQHQLPCTTVDMRVKVMKGGASGGTLASILNLSKEASKDPALRKELANPYSICPPLHGKGVKQIPITVGHDEDNDSWYAPFVMEAINSRVVHRSNALSGCAYGESFKYSEAMLTGAGGKGRRMAKTMRFGLGAFMLGTAIAPIRGLLGKFILTQPGDGPSPEEQLDGGFDLRFKGQTDSGEIVRAAVTGDRDPGYGSTAKMLSQAALCLAQDEPLTSGGCWTPAAALGVPLRERLIAYAGLEFTQK